MSHSRAAPRKPARESDGDPEEIIEPRRPFPMPAFINFSALLILFTTIFLLNHYGPRWQGAKVPSEAAQPLPQAVEDTPKAVEKEAASTKDAAEVPHQELPVAAMVVQTLPAVIAQVPQPAPPPPPQEEVAEEKPPAAMAAVAPAKREARKARARWDMPDTDLKPRNIESVAEATVEHLDSEAVRQGYLASSRAGKPDSGKKATETAPSAAAQGPKASTTNNNYFIPFENRR